MRRIHYSPSLILSASSLLQCFFKRFQGKQKVCLRPQKRGRAACLTFAPFDVVQFGALERAVTVFRPGDLAERTVQMPNLSPPVLLVPCGKPLPGRGSTKDC